ncbi:MAG: very short patch repair endonuclease [Saprospiraceae bacterium]
MDVLNPEQRKRNMQANKSKGTLPEILLAKNLWRQGYRYRKNLSTVVGKPDIAFPKYKVAVFIDGEFWHGKDWDKKKETISSNREYWIPKIERNMARDAEVKYHLEQKGWKVLRYWSKEVKNNLASCTGQIIAAIEEAKKQS